MTNVCLPKQAPLKPVALPSLGDRPLVSIIVPSFNQGRFIRQTIDSILSQDYRPIEVIVIDGASTDETVDMLRSYGDVPELTWISERDDGVVHAVNKGFAKVTGDIIGIQSSDDAYEPGALCRVVDEFRAHANTGLVYGDTIKVDAGGRELQKSRVGAYSLENLLLIKTWIPQPSAFFRREMLDVCGGWDERIPYAPDTDLWIRMAFRTEVRKIDTYLSRRRMHDAQRDTQAAKIVRDYARMIDQSSDIAAAEPMVRKAAHAGKHLMHVRYNESGHDWSAAGALVRAGLADRRAWDVRRITHFLLLPGRRFLSLVKQNVFGLPGREMVLEKTAAVRQESAS